MTSRLDPDLMDQIDWIIKDHDNRWSQQENAILLAESLYAGQWWSRYATVHEPMAADFAMAGNALLETEEGHTTVESALAQVFVSSPGVVVQPDPTDPDATQPGIAPAIQELVNNWLSRAEFTAALKQAARWGLIYPYSGLALEGEPGVLRATPLKPWDVIVDRKATSPRGDDWSYIGRVHRLTKAEAKAAGFSLGRGQRWAPKPLDPIESPIQGKAISPPPSLGTVEIIEWHDLIHDEVYYLTQQDYVTGARSDLTPLIPVNCSQDRWSRILPLYLGTGAIRPLDGSSLLGRMAPALVMKNWLLTMYARRSKRASVKTLASSRLGEDALIKLTNGILDEIIPVEAPGDLSALVRNIDSNSNPQEWSDAFTLVQSEIDRSINMPSFARGQATRATATEVLELQSYASSLIGLTAYQVNDLIRASAQAFLDKVTVDLTEDPIGEPIVILVDSQPSLLDATATGASYRFTPVESIASPMGGAVERRALLQVLPVLTASPDVDKRALVEHVVRTFDLPLDLIAPPQAAAPAGQEGQPSPSPLGKVNVTEAVLESTLPSAVLARPEGG